MLIGGIVQMYRPEGYHALVAMRCERDVHGIQVLAAETCGIPACHILLGNRERERVVSVARRHVRDRALASERYAYVEVDVAFPEHVGGDLHLHDPVVVHKARDAVPAFHDERIIDHQPDRFVYSDRSDGVGPEVPCTLAYQGLARHGWREVLPPVELLLERVEDDLDGVLAVLKGRGYVEHVAGEGVRHAAHRLPVHHDGGERVHR